MSTAVLPASFELNAAAGTAALRGAARFWFTVTFIGQWLFLYYIGALYGPSTLTGHFEIWRKNKFLLKGYVPGDTAGNLAFAAHVLFAAVIAFGGALQVMPQIRARSMAIHRWIGRAFIFTALGVSFSGLHIVWVRGIRQTLLHGVSVSLNAVLIIVCSIVAWRAARKHDVSAHRRWALRTFMVTNGQWFVRVGYVAWAVLNHGRHLAEFGGVWDYLCYLLPLGVLELYLRTKEEGSPRSRFAMAGSLIALTLLTIIGIIGASAFMWTRILSRL